MPLDDADKAAGNGSVQLLIVDDDEAIARNLALFMEDEGFNVVTALNGEDAIELLGTLSIQVAIVDMRLPGMDGNEVILKAHQLQPQLRFIIYTGSTNYVLSHWMKAIGISEDDIFLKPVEDMRKLSEKILELVSE